MWFDWITASASARSLLIADPDGLALPGEVPPAAERSGLAVRRADLLFWAIINAGSARAITRSTIPGAKDLFLTQPSLKTCISRVLTVSPGFGWKHGGRQ